MAQALQYNTSSTARGISKIYNTIDDSAFTTPRYGIDPQVSSYYSDLLFREPEPEQKDESWMKGEGIPKGFRGHRGKQNESWNKKFKNQNKHLF
jgi:hypothetical protein